MSSTDRLLSEKDLDLQATCQTCDHGLPSISHPPYTRARYWIVSLAIQSVVFLLGLFILKHVAGSPPSSSSQTVSQVDSSAGQKSNQQLPTSFVGTYLSPLNGHVPHKVESTSADYWNTPLYFGEPTYDSDRAWNNLTTPRLFRLHRDEAVRLGFEDSVLVEPGEDYATILGVIHNLHCLRRIRQMLYSDYYYPDALQDELDYNRAHSLHCLEAIRTSILCYPDLNPHPYFWSGNPYHNITVSGKIQRQCVDWEALQKVLEPRDFDSSLLMSSTGPGM